MKELHQTFGTVIVRSNSIHFVSNDYSIFKKTNNCPKIIFIIFKKHIKLTMIVPINVDRSRPYES